ncbi:N-acetylmuramoyl-L-alanine amidase [Sulfitobacter sp. SK012]|uniref:N-acetylmuramoyl-L-alanine amidase n=1 Tax=Sulfitobacter sp. SK012 TaxID=1389005 RepID=UPI000E0C7781|nr:N-acetylmuramoyl-L-alanine amidase [Sulfitobacter sp. SK012]AXI47501.1 N-acetylmuramoyl-L-alanine amidase [Sulfitobacter sp. SK012]
MHQYPSPNCGPRRGGILPELIVIHYTAMQSAQAAIERLCDPEAEVSAHYVIASNGTVTQLVDEDQRAWHAGSGSWQGQGDVNSRSIGVELDNAGTHPFSEPQMAALEALLRGTMARWSIPAGGVIGHSDMAPGRKSDPGQRFDWARLARQGLAGHATGPALDGPASEEGFRAAATKAGYPADTSLDVLLQATRLRFAPWRTGPLCAADLALHHGL